MPIFEYRCNQCHKRFSALVGVLAQAHPPACPRCGGTDLQKLVSRFARVRSEEDALEDLADESRYGDIENDPKAMRQWVRDMGKAMDEDMEEDLEAALDEELSGKQSGATGDDDTVY
jgi:putative FmdB family regulatory protein